MSNPFETHIRSKMEQKPEIDSVDHLIDQFPEELHDRLEQEIEGLDDKSAEDYLVNKLVQRKESLVQYRAESLAKDIEISNDIPLAVLSSIETSKKQEETTALGEGKNGKVYQSLRREHACYKVLFNERVKELQLNIIREAAIQHDIEQLLTVRTDVAQAPQVLGFVEHPDVRAIMMEKIDGASLLAIFEGNAELPEHFDIEAFFEKLEQAVILMNEHGYFHRDLTNNAGNVMIDREGSPWIVDFGSAVKAINPTGDTLSYQLTAGGARLLANDLSGVRNLRQRVEEYVAKRARS